MKSVVTILVLLGLWGSAWATNGTVSLSWEPDPSWQIAEGGTYLDLPIDDVTAPRRLAVHIFNRGKLIGLVWDDPDNRAVNVSMEMADAVAHIRAQAVAYECGPWQASAVVNVGDKVCSSTYPSRRFFMEVLEAGTTGVEEPDWPLKHPFRLALRRPINSQDAVDNGDGTVGIPVTTPPYFTGDTVVISGTDHYDGTYTLPDQSLGAGSMVIITAPYTSEEFDISQASIRRAGSEIIDNLDDSVNIPFAGAVEGVFSAGMPVTVVGLSQHYDGTAILPVQTTPGYLTWPVAFEDGSPFENLVAGGTAFAGTVTDGSVEWSMQDADPPMVVLESEKSRRIIGRKGAPGELLHQSGTRFQLRSAP